MFADFLLSYFNVSKREVSRLTSKKADEIPISNKSSRKSNDNYRPASIFSNTSKLFVKPSFKLMPSLFHKNLSVYQRGFRKGFSAQHCLVVTLEKLKFYNDKGKSFGALLAYLSKAFDCLSHELLIAKLQAYKSTNLSEVDT